MKRGEKPKSLKLHNTQTILDLVIGKEATTVAIAAFFENRRTLQ